MDRNSSRSSRKTISYCLNSFLLGMENYGDQLIEIIVLEPDYLFILEPGPGEKLFEARGKLIQGQDSAPDKVYIWETTPGHGLG